MNEYIISNLAPHGVYDGGNPWIKSKAQKNEDVPSSVALVMVVPLTVVWICLAQPAVSLLLREQRMMQNKMLRVEENNMLEQVTTPNHLLLKCPPLMGSRNGTLT